MKNDICKVDSCDRLVRCKSLCDMHYQRHRKYGDTKHRGGYEQHGYKGHPLYDLYQNIKTRCTNQNRDNYHRYGGKGISLSSEWMHSPKSFIEWALLNGWRSGLSIDRVSPTGDYSPQNCRFISLSENSRCAEKKRNLYWAFDRNEPLGTWAAMSGIKYCTLWSRINRSGYSLEKSLLLRGKGSL